MSSPYSRVALANSSTDRPCARAALVDRDDEVRQAAHQRAGHPGVIEVDVREQDRARDALAERRDQRLLAGLRARVDQHVADAVAATTCGAPEVEDVDLLLSAGHRRATTMSGNALAPSRGVHEPWRMPAVLNPASATRSRNHSSSTALSDSPSSSRRGAVAVGPEGDRGRPVGDRRAGALVEHVRGREQPALGDQDAARLAQPRADGVGPEAREVLVHDDDVECRVRKRQHEVVVEQAVDGREGEVGAVLVAVSHQAIADGSSSMPE